MARIDQAITPARKSCAKKDDAMVGFCRPNNEADISA
jgi:hypothetical protein